MPDEWEGGERKSGERFGGVVSKRTGPTNRSAGSERAESGLVVLSQRGRARRMGGRRAKERRAVWWAMNYFIVLDFLRAVGRFCGFSANVGILCFRQFFLVRFL